MKDGHSLQLQLKSEAPVEVLCTSILYSSKQGVKKKVQLSMEKMLFSSLHLNKLFSDWFLVSVSYITEYSMRFILH